MQQALRTTSLLTSLIGLALLTGCSHSPSLADVTSTPAIQSGIHHQGIDPSVRPGDDFFDYVNGQWLKTTPIPDDKSHVGTFTQLADQVRLNVHRIILQAEDHGTQEGGIKQQIGDLYRSFMNTQQLDQQGITPLKPALAKLDAIYDARSLASAFATNLRQGGSAPFDISIGVDARDPSRYIPYLSQSGLGMLDRSYYLNTDAQSLKLQHAYTDYIAQVLNKANLVRSNASAHMIFDLEKKLARLQWSRVEQRNADKTHNKMSLSEVRALLPHLDWPEFIKQAGLNKQQSFMISEPSYLKGLDQLLRDTPYSQWRLYLKWQLLNQYAPYLGSPFEKLQFAFYGKTLKGVQQQQPRWQRGTELVNSVLGEAVGQLYVARYFPPSSKARMKTLVANIRKAYAVSIQHLDWMTPATKKQALEKLAKFEPKIGYPNQWQNYSSLMIQIDDLVGNLLRSARYEYQRQLKKLGQPIDREEWSMSPQTVNAYYDPTLNQIVFPAAILQPPFFNPSADDAVNYGAIGGVIGHEMGHGFDDQGAKSDGDGKLRNWWTGKDKQEFQKRTASLAQQYATYQALPGIHVNGKLTLGENIGDLGGLSIAYKAYQIALDGKPAPIIDKLSGDQRFFIGWAQVWRSKYRPEQQRLLLKIDPHSPAKLRVNGVVSNMPAFYKAFDVKPGDTLYRSKTQQVKIW